jgi:hypothetical protein
MRWRVGVVVAACLAAAGLTGCDGGPAGATVSGEVKVNGVPVAAGVIAYVPADSTGSPVTAEIKDGRYEVRTTAGSKRVQISVPVVTGRRKAHVGPDAPWIEVTKESLPDRYHTRTELTLDVKSGSNTKDWDLAVKKK